MNISLSQLLQHRWRLTAGAVMLLGGPFLALQGKAGKRTAGSAEAEAGSLMATVTSGRFLREVIERGEVQSSSNVEIRCEVPSRGANGTAILEIVPEGTYVSEGDFLVRLDDSGLQSELVTQQIACNTSYSLLLDGQAQLEAATLARDEYESGPFRQEEQTLESSEFVAQEDVRRAEEYVRYSEKLVARGYATEVQLDADRFAVQKARKDLELVRTKLDVLRRVSRKKMVTQLETTVKTSEARLRSLEATAKLDQERFKQIQNYIAACVIKAPTSGQVVYANDTTTSTNGEPLIAEGKSVRERQIITRLPDPKRMRVLTRVNEARIDVVRKKMKARIMLDALPELELSGIVQAVSEYPLPSSVPYGTVKEYAAEIEIQRPPQELRAGMTARVSIEVTLLDDAVQVPLQAVIERDKRFFCLLPGEDDGVEAREVELGPANDAMVVIKHGLAPNEQVYLAPQNYEKEAALPAAEPKHDHQLAAAPAPK